MTTEEKINSLLVDKTKVDKQLTNEIVYYLKDYVFQNGSEDCIDIPTKCAPVNFNIGGGYFDCEVNVTGIGIDDEDNLIILCRVFNDKWSEYNWYEWQHFGSRLLSGIYYSINN